MDDEEPLYWKCNACDEEVHDENERCCLDGNNVPVYAEN
jgi:hypothetical protein